MTRDEKIAKIYEVIADKTLSYGCKMESYYNQEIHRLSYAKNIKYLIWLDDYCNEEDLLDSWKIIWHPVMIWDVLERMIYDQDLCFDGYMLIWNNNDDEPIRKKLKEPIENQTDACINFIYKIVKCSTT